MSDDPFVEEADTEDDEGDGNGAASNGQEIATKSPGLEGPGAKARAAGDAGAVPVSAAAMAPPAATEAPEVTDESAAVQPGAVVGAEAARELSAGAGAGISAGSNVADSGSVPGASLEPTPADADTMEPPSQPPIAQDAPVASESLAPVQSSSPPMQQHAEPQPPAAPLRTSMPLDADFFSGETPAPVAPAVTKVPMSQTQAPLKAETPVAPRPSEARDGPAVATGAAQLPMSEAQAPLAPELQQAPRSSASDVFSAQQQQQQQLPFGDASAQQGMQPAVMADSALPVVSEESIRDLHDNVGGAAGSMPSAANPFGEPDAGSSVPTVVVQPQASASSVAKSATPPWGEAPKPTVLGGADELPSGGQIVMPSDGQGEVPLGLQNVGTQPDTSEQQQGLQGMHAQMAAAAAQGRQGGGPPV